MGAKLLDLQAGRQFVDRYELIGEIASGGMATVFLARLTGFGGFQRLFAIKRLHPHLQGEREFVQMFLDEARLAAGIHHPNVVPILEVGASDSGYYLVMEYIEGETLARLLSGAAASKQRLPVSIVVRLMIDTLGGLNAAHELMDETGQLAGVVHRDVSPQNVLVGVDGIARITDFGVARAASRLTATGVGQLKGKIAYMAPEQARGEEDLDRRADVFAAGVVLWESLAHRRLFKASSEAATLNRVLNEPLPDLREVAPHVSAAVCQVVMQALSRDRNERIATCAEFADALEAAAGPHGELGTSRDLQAYVQTVLGNNINAQRDAIRAWTARADAQGGPVPLHTPSRSTNGGMERSQVSEVTRLESRWGRSLLMMSMIVFGIVGSFLGYRKFIQGIDDFGPGVASHTAVQGVQAGSQLTPPPKVVEIAAEPAQLPGDPSAQVPSSTSAAGSKESSTAGSQEISGKPKAAPAESQEAAAKKTERTPTTEPRPTTRPKPKRNALDALDSNPYR